MHPIYEKLADFLGQTGNVGKLPKPKENGGRSDDGMKKLIVDQYKKIRGDCFIETLSNIIPYWFSFMHNCNVPNFNISGKVRVTPMGNDDLTMFFQQMSKGGTSKSVTSHEDKKFMCPTGKTNKQEFECTGIPARGKHEIWGKVMQ